MNLDQAASFESPERLEDMVFPAGDAPSIAPHRVHNIDAPVAPFAANSWPLAALGTVNRPTPTLHFRDWPEGFQSFARHVAYALINHGNPEILIEENASNTVRWPSSGTIASAISRLRVQVVWLTGEWSRRHPTTPVTVPNDLDAQHLDDLKRWIEQTYPLARARGAHLTEIVRLWHLTPWLPDDSQWPEPGWRHSRWVPTRRKEENKTVPISEQSFGPLLEWAIAFVTHFAPDIFEAHGDYIDRTEGRAPRKPYMAARTCLEQYARAGMPLPGKDEPTASVLQPAWHVMEYRHGIPPAAFASVYKGALKESLQVVGDVALTALEIRVDGRVQGQPWIPLITVYDVTHAGAGRQAVKDGGPLIRHLRTACLIVVAALTGMRPDEVLSLKPGCAPDALLRQGGSRLQLIHGHVFKGSGRLEDGSPAPPREAVWATIPVVATAIHTAEQIYEVLGRDSGPLFAEGSSPVHTVTGTVWVESFIEFVNSRLVQHSPAPSAYTIPRDSDGAITLKRFRRTLAWFLRHRPNGDVTAAIQYQHAGVAMGEGYAGTKASGMPGLLLEEDWNHRKDTIRHLADLLSSGAGVGGPAAKEAVEAARRLPRHLLPADERRLRKDKSLAVYDNPAAVAICIYKEESALCKKLKQTGNDTRPDLLGCVDGCLNSVRTDDHIARISLDTTVLRAQASLAPEPMAQSMLAEADRKERIVFQFQETRITLDSEEK